MREGEHIQTTLNLTSFTKENIFQVNELLTYIQLFVDWRKKNRSICQKLVTRKKNSPIRNQLTFSLALFERNSFLSGKNNDTGEVRTYDTTFSINPAASSVR
jgi:hypothetical protein